MKRVKRLPFRVRRKASAGIVAAVILFAMIFTVGTSYFISINNTNLLYLKSLTTKTQGTQNAGYESLTVTALLQTNNIKFYANNTGSLPVNITAAYVLDSSGNVLKCFGVGIPVSAPCYYSTTALSTVVNIGKGSATIDTGYAYVSGTDTVKVLTARGNVFSGSYPSVASSQVQATVAQAVGSLVIVQGSFRFYYGEVYSLGNGYPAGGYFAYVMPTTTKAVLKIQIKNSDPDQRSVTINQKSLISLGGAPSTSNWYVVSTVSSSSPHTAAVTVTAYSTGVTIAYGATTTFYFGATTAGGTIIQSTSSSGPLGVFLLLYGQYSDTKAYSQTIPFEATYLTSAKITSATTSGCAGSIYTANLQSATWSSAPRAYFVSSSGSSTDITSGTPTTSEVQYQIPAGTATGYYQIFLSNQIDQAYMTFQVTC